jgi:hypothetical protein
MTQKRRYQLAVAAACVLASSSMGGLVGQERGALGGAVMGGAIGSILARVMAAMLDTDPPAGKDG